MVLRSDLYSALSINPLKVPSRFDCILFVVHKHWGFLLLYSAQLSQSIIYNPWTTSWYGRCVVVVAPYCLLGISFQSTTRSLSFGRAGLAYLQSIGQLRSIDRIYAFSKYVHIYNQRHTRCLVYFLAVLAVRGCSTRCSTMTSRASPCSSWG